MLKSKEIKQGANDDFKSQVLAYGAGAMGFTMISSAFGFYYVKVFLNLYHIEQRWFQIAQLIYLVWNAVNDPLFAYLQDKRNLSFTRTRRESVLYAAPLFALAFLVPWFPWGGGPIITGLHLIVSLCLWDAMYSFVGLAQCCMFTEMSEDANYRVKLIQGSQIGSLLGSGTIAILELTSRSLEYIHVFQFMTVVISLCSWLLFRYMGFHAHTKFDKKLKDEDKETAGSEEVHNSYWKLTIQIISNKNFLVFVAINFLHGFHKTFLGNFMAIICEQLVTLDQVSPWVRRVFYGSIPIAAHLFVIFGSGYLKQVGYVKAIRANFIWKITGGTALFFIGQNHPYLIMAFLMLDSCFGSATFSLFNIPLADIADDDMKRYKRRRPNSSMIFGTNALLMKPALSVSPMMVVAILNHHGYAELNQSDENRLDDKQLDNLRHVMFLLVCLIPVFVGITQCLIWSMFKASKPSSDTTRDV